MAFPQTRYPNISSFTEADRREIRFTASGVLGVGTADVTNALAPIRCDETEVALIDEVEMTAIPNNTATDLRCTIAINGRTSGELGASSSANAIELPFHFPGNAAAAAIRRGDRISLRPRGNMVVHPSSTLWVKASAANVVNCHIKWRKKRLTRAIADGDIKPNGTLPQCASTNTLTGGGTAGGTAKQIIAATGNSFIEILGLYLTGHSFNAATDNIRIGFWDGNTGGGGTFAANGNTLFRAYAAGASNAFQPRVLIDDLRGCVQTGSTNHCYIEATANLAGATPPADYVVIYRRVNVSDCGTLDGFYGQTPTSRRKWWLNIEAGQGGTVTGFFADPGLTTDEGKQMVKVLGHAYSCTCSNGTAGIIGLHWGNAAGENLSDVALVNGDGGAATVSSTGFRTGLNTLIRLNQVPGFVASGAVITNREQLAWGTFGAQSDTANRFTPIAS